MLKFQEMLSLDDTLTANASPGPDGILSFFESEIDNSPALLRTHSWSGVMLKITSVLIVVCLLACYPNLLLSQENTPAAEIKGNGATQSISISNLQKQLIEALARIEKLEKQIVLIAETTASVNEELGGLKNANRTAVLDPAIQDQYQRIDSDSGFFVLSLDKVEPYLDGYKLTIEIGNLCTAKYSAFKLDATWGPKYRGALGNQEYRKKWAESYQKKQFPYADTLFPGQWNTVELILPNTKANDLGLIYLSLTTGNMSFLAKIK